MPEPEDDGYEFDIDEDDEFMSPMFEMAVATHEFYEAYMEAGFTSQQALWLAMCENKDFLEPPED